MATFRTDSGKLNAYAFSCGYIDRREFWDGREGERTKGRSVTMWHEHGCYHVRANCLFTAKQVEWFASSKLTDARKAYSRMCREARAYCNHD